MVDILDFSQIFFLDMEGISDDFLMGGWLLWTEVLLVNSGILFACTGAATFATKNNLAY